MIRYLISFLLLIRSNDLISQWHISLKTGAASTLAVPVPSKHAFAYSTVAHERILPTLGLEAAHPLKNRKNFLTGIVLFPISGVFDFNPENIDISQSYMASLNVYDYNVQIFAGIEQQLKKQNAPFYKNYFSVFGGLGLNYFYHNSGERGTIVPSYGKSKNGELLAGMDAGISNNIFGTPSVFGGIAYNITNTKGKKVVCIELLLNYGIVKYFDWRVIYELDGVQQKDYIPEHGFNIQLNVKVSLFKTH